MRKILAVAICLAFALSLIAQNDCPQVPKTGKFDSLTFIKTGIPTDATKPSGKIYLGQGTIYRGVNDIRPAFIPSNHPEWAIAVAVAWNYERNLIKRVNYPPIGYWLGTVVQESELSCVTGTTWDDPLKIPANMPNATTIMNHDGCFQIESTTAWAQLKQNYPLGRFPTNLFETVVEGPTGFESSALVKTYFDVYTTSVWNNNMGWDIYESIDCTCDPLAYVKTSASGYNCGINCFAGNAGYFNGSMDDVCNWTGMPGAFAGYPDEVAQWTAVLENMQDYPSWPTGSSFDSYYNGDMTWTMVENYIDVIDIMYPEVDWAAVKTDVQGVFNGMASGGTIPFEDMGPVIDKIILNIPMDYPQPIEGAPMGYQPGVCEGESVPYGDFKLLNGSNNLCIGQSITLEAMIKAGGGDNPTYKWYLASNPSSILSTNKIYTYVPTTAGTETIAAEICNDVGCYVLNCNNGNACLDERNLCGIRVEIENCSNCNFVAAATSNNTPCKGMADGSITLNLTNAPANYQVALTGATPLGAVGDTFNTSGNSVNIQNLRDGSYNVVLTDLNDPNCKAYTQVIVDYDTDINFYVEGEMLSTDNCIADVQAEVKEQPAPCKFYVKAWMPEYLTWENWVNLGITTSNGQAFLERFTRIAPVGEINQYSQVYLCEANFELNSGDQMNLALALTAAPGASQQRDYRVNVFDEDGALLYDATALAGSATVNTPYFFPQTITAQCPENVPDYTFSWNPNISNIVNTTTTSSGDISMLSTNQKIVVTAVNAANPQCILRDTVEVAADPSCESCVPPSSAILSMNPATGNACIGDTVSLSIAASSGESLRYTFFKDGLTVQTYTTATSYNATQAGDYTVRVYNQSDSTCNVLSNSITVTVNTLPTVDAGNDDSVCQGAAASLAASGANSYLWSSGATTAGISLSPVVITTYTVTGTDANGCTDADEVIIDIISFDPSLGDETSCEGENATLTASGGTSYTWNTGGTYDTIVVSPANTTTYTVTIDNSGCKDTLTASVTVLKSPVNTTGDNICEGQTATISATGGGTYAWNTGASTASVAVTPVVDTDYSVTITLSGCTASGTASVIVNGNPTASAVASPWKVCPGANATLTASGGSSYMWSSGQTSQSVTVKPVLAATYTVTVTNASGCTDQDTTVVSVFPGTTPDAGTNDSICTGESTLLQATGGGTYLWYDGTTRDTLRVSPLVSSVFTVTVSNNGCRSSDTVYIKVNPLPGLDAGSPTQICLNRGVTLQATGGSLYLWSNGATTDTTTVAPASSQNYTVTATTQSACTTTDFVQVTINALPVVDAGQDKPLCKDNATSLSPTNDPDYSYDWSAENGGVINNASSKNPSVSYTDPAGLLADTNVTFYLEVTNGKGCKNTDSVTVTFEKECRSTVTVSASKTTICLGDTISVNAAIDTIKAVVSLTWNHVALTDDNVGPFSVSPNVNITYTAIIEDVDGGRDTSQVAITVNPLPTASAGPDTNICLGTAVTLNASGGTGYSWNNSVSTAANTVSPVVNTTYTVTATNSFNCTGTDDAVVLIRALPNADAGGTQTICPGDTTSLTASGGATYKWGSGETTATITVAPQIDAIYKVTVTDAYGCSESHVVPIVLHPQVNADAGENVAVCLGNSASLAASGGDQFIWTTSETITGITVTPGLTTVYSVTVTASATSCSAMDTIVVTVNTLPTANAGGDRQICIGRTANLAEQNTSMKSYLWSDAKATRTNAVAPNMTTTYGITITDYNDCSDDTALVLTVYPLPVVAFDTTTTVCTNTSPFTLSGGEPTGGTYSGTGVASNIFSPSTAGNFAILYTFTDTNTCSASASANITVMDIPQPTLADTGICEGSNLSMTAKNGTNYLWNDGTTNATMAIAPVATTTYSLTVSVTGGCSVLDEVVITVNPIPTVNISADSASGCAPFTAAFSNNTSPTPQNTYWYFGESADSGSVTSNANQQLHQYLIEGSYSITAVAHTAQGCSDDQTYINMITVLPKPVAAFIYDPKSPTTLEPSVDFRSLSNHGIESWLWDFGDNGSIHNNEQNTTEPTHAFSGTGAYPVTLIITDASGCSDTTILMVYVKADHVLYIPNAFSPNNDGLNDTFIISGMGIDSKDYALYIYTRWGEQIFHGTSLKDGWDGSKNYEPVPTGIYHYVIKYRDLEGVKFKKKGLIEIIK